MATIKVGALALHDSELLGLSGPLDIGKPQMSREVLHPAGRNGR